MTTGADNLSAIYLSTVVFCDVVTKYCAKKSKQYFGAEKKPKPQSAVIPQKTEKVELPISLDEIDKFRFTRSQARELATGETKSKPNQPSKKSAQNDSEGDEDEDEEEEEEEDRIERKRKSQNEKTRKQQEKLDELIAIQESGVRRSGRNSNRRKMIIEEDDDYEVIYDFSKEF